MCKSILIVVTMFGMVSGLLCSNVAEADERKKARVELHIYSRVSGPGIADYRAEDGYPSEKRYWQRVGKTIVMWYSLEKESLACGPWWRWVCGKEHLAIAKVAEVRQLWPPRLWRDHKWYTHDEPVEIVKLWLKPAR